ncbi:hypothetical protein MLD38_000486 [Melastoma candidum]|uniref:Uncharacterized protein n=1 Tax=Melastoma candidum TaxID=119954 RepID=A0ACB9SF63_9MYRT|nr:hypothetical protein MLD38_000486 [Melastoma candidum]
MDKVMPILGGVGGKKERSTLTLSIIPKVYLFLLSPPSSPFPTTFLLIHKRKGIHGLSPRLTIITSNNPKGSYNHPTTSTPLQEAHQDQVRLLERSFILNKRLDPERKLQLAAELDVPPRQVAIWYQNRRARWKTQTLELDHSALRLKLDSALEEKERLRKDVEVLQGELRRART